MTAQERKSFENGIWLCQSCSKLIDSDEIRYTVGKLKKWKELSEQMAVLELEEVTVSKNDEDKELIKFLYNVLTDQHSMIEYVKKEEWKILIRLSKILLLH